MSNLLKRDFNVCKFKLYRQRSSKKIYLYKKIKETLNTLKKELEEELI